MLFAADVLVAQSRARDHLRREVARATSSRGSRAHGGKPLLWKTGHSLIKAKMKETGAPLAGEMSGHMFFKERWYGFDDGLYAGARLLEILSRRRRSVGACSRRCPTRCRTPELNMALRRRRAARADRASSQSSATFPGRDAT